MTVLRQADRRWSTLLLGDGSSTIGGAGCVLVSLVQIAIELETRPGMLPPHANEACRKAKAFDGSMLRVHDAAPVLGLDAPLSQRVVTADGATRKDLMTALEAVIGDGGCALLRVRYLGPDGKDRGHTISCVSLPSTDIPSIFEALCRDPAPGCDVRLMVPDLIGISPWGKGDLKRYTVTGVRPVRRAAV